VSEEAAPSALREGEGVLASAASWVSDPVWRLGRVVEGRRLSHTFLLANRTPDSVRVVKAASSCGCLTVKPIERTLLEPGAAAQVRVEMDTKGLRGRVRKLIHVEIAGTSGRGTDRIFLAVTADVTGVSRFVCEPYEIGLGDVEPSEVVTRTVTVRSTGREGPRNLFSAPDSAAVRAAVLPGPMDHAVLLKAVVVVPATPGPFEHRIRIGSEQDSVEPYVLRVCGRVRSEIEVRPARMFLGELHGGRGFSKRVVVRHRSGEAFRVKEVTVSSPALGVERMSPDGPASTALLRVCNKERLEAGPLLADVGLQLRTNAGTEELTLRVAGIVVE
jgi:hypothetical protein